jgi:hypothetical protein
MRDEQFLYAGLDLSMTQKFTARELGRNEPAWACRYFEGGVVIVFGRRHFSAVIDIHVISTSRLHIDDAALTRKFGLINVRRHVLEIDCEQVAIRASVRPSNSLQHAFTPPTTCNLPTHNLHTMGSICSAIGRAINGVISAIANVIMSIVGGW